MDDLDQLAYDEEEEDWTQVLQDTGTCYQPAAPLPSPLGSKSKSEWDRSKVAEVADKLEDQGHLEDDHSRVIVHLDVDCFYAQVEELRNPHLKGKPIGVFQKHLMITCNYVARRMGVSKHMKLSEARKQFPDLVLINGEDLTPYRNMSHEITEFLKRWSPLVERLGFDENYIDVTDVVVQPEWCHLETGTGINGHIYEQDGDTSTGIPKTCPCGCHQRLIVASHLAASLRTALQTELGITTCGGIAHNKVLAKLAGATHKPNQQTTVFPAQGRDLIGTLSGVKKIPGIGRSMAQRLEQLGVSSIVSLQTCEPSHLEGEFGLQMAARLKALGYGIDATPVVPSGRPQTMSEEDAVGRCETLSEAKRHLDRLLEALLVRLLDDGRTAKTLRLTICRGKEFYHRESRQCPIPGNVLSSLQQGNIEGPKTGLLELAITLLRRLLDVNRAFNVKVLNIGFAKLVEKDGSDISSYFVTKPTHANDSVAMDINNLESVASRNMDENADNMKATRSMTTAVRLTKDIDSLEFCGLTTNTTFTILKQSADNSQAASSGFPKSTGILSKSERKVFPFGMIFMQRGTASRESVGTLHPVEVKAQAQTKFSDLWPPQCGVQKEQTLWAHESADIARDGAQPSCKKHSNVQDAPSSPQVKRIKGEGVANLPAGMDSEEFSQRPREMQMEVPTHPGLQPGSHSFAQLQSESCDSDSKLLHPASSRLGSEHDIASSTAAAALCGSCDHATQSSSASDTKVSCATSEAAMSCGRPAVKPESLPAKPNSFKKGQQGMEELVVPPHMDRAVFFELPQDVQEALVKDWRLEQEFKKMKSRQKSPCKQSKKSTGSIAKYFSRATHK